MKKSILKAFFVLACMLCGNMVFSQTVTLPTVLDNVPFFMTDTKNEHSDDFSPVYYIPKGTNATILGRMWYDTKVRVKLQDGSIGYMPTIAFAYHDNITFESDYGLGNNVPAGKFRLVGIGKWIDEYGRPSLKPSCYKYRNLDTGNISELEGEFDAYGNTTIKVLGDFFERYPSIDKDVWVRGHELKVFTLKNGELPLTYVGCSRSYIESKLGEPYGYIGYDLSHYQGYSYAFYQNVVYDSDTKNIKNAGLIIYYDSDSIAVAVEKRPLDFQFRPDKYILYPPRRSVRQSDTLLVNFFKENAVQTSHKVAPDFVVSFDEGETEPSWTDEVLTGLLQFSNLYRIIGLLLLTYLLHLIRMRYGLAIFEFVNGCINAYVAYLLLTNDWFWGLGTDALSRGISLLGENRICILLMTVIFTALYVQFWRWVLINLFRAGSNGILKIIALIWSVGYLLIGVFAEMMNLSAGFIVGALGVFVAFLGVLRVLSVINLYRCPHCHATNTSIIHSDESYNGFSLIETPYQDVDLQVEKDGSTIKRISTKIKGTKQKGYVTFVKGHYCTRCGCTWGTERNINVGESKSPSEEEVKTEIFE